MTEFIARLAWVSWLNISILLATLALGLFNASKDDIAQTFAFVYALISVCTLVGDFVIVSYFGAKLWCRFMVMSSINTVYP